MVYEEVEKIRQRGLADATVAVKDCMPTWRREFNHEPINDVDPAFEQTD